MTETVRLLLTSNIPGLATQYALLRQRIVGEKMNELWASCYTAQPPITNPVMQQQWTVPLTSFAQPAASGDHTFQFVMESDGFEQDTFSFE